MRFSKLIAQSVRMMSRDDAEAYVGGQFILKLMEEAWPEPWVKAVVKRHRMTLFDVKDLDAACDRLHNEWPEAAPAEEEEELAK